MPICPVECPSSGGGGFSAGNSPRDNNSPFDSNNNPAVKTYFWREVLDKDDKKEASVGFFPTSQPVGKFSWTPFPSRSDWHDPKTKHKEFYYWFDDGKKEVKHTAVHGKPKPGTRYHWHFDAEDKKGKPEDD